MEFVLIKTAWCIFEPSLIPGCKILGLNIQRSEGGNILSFQTNSQPGNNNRRQGDLGPPKIRMLRTKSTK